MTLSASLTRTVHVGSLTPFYCALSYVPLNCELRPWRGTCVCVSERITQVRTDIYVTSFGPVSDTEMVSALAARPGPL